MVTTGDNVYYDGSTLYFSNDQIMADSFELRITDDEASSGRQNASSETAFGNSPTDSDYTGGYWSLTYTINQNENCDGILTINVSDNCGNWNTTTLSVTLDNTEPALSVFAYTETPDFAAWGEKWFDPATLTDGKIHFTWTNSDGSSGLAAGEMDWTSTGGSDQNDMNAGTDGYHNVTGLADDGSGNITVTVYIYDNVNNVNSSILTFNFDADDPTNLALPNINEITNGNNIYFSGSQDLFYNSSVRIPFHLVVTYDDAQSGRNRSHGPALFGDTPTNSSYNVGHYLYYTIEIGRTDNNNNFIVTVYDNVGRSATITFDVIRDVTPPTISDTTIYEAVNQGNLFQNSTSHVLYYNNTMNVPEFDVRVVCSDTQSGRSRAEGETRFADTPTDDTYSSRYDIRYSIENVHVFNGTITITVYDSVNNYERTTITVRRDVYAPPRPGNIRVDPDGFGTYLHYDDDDTVYLYWDFVSDDPGGSDIFYYFADVNDNTPQTAVTQGHNYHSDTGPEGYNTFYLWVCDNVGNYCPVGGDWIVVDTGPPEITGVTVTSDTSWYYTAGLDPAAGGTVWFNSNQNEGAGQTVTLTFNWLDDYEDFVNVTAVFGGDAVKDANSAGGWKLGIVIPQGGGDHFNIRFWVVDKANNTDTVVIDFRVDNDAPVAPVSVMCRPGGVGGVGDYSDSTTVWLTWTDSTGDARSGLKEHRMGTNIAALNNAIHVSGDTETGEEGLETFYVFAVDHVGNFVAVTDTITIDLTNPVITEISISSTRHYYYNQSLGPGGGVIWFNSANGMGAGQELKLSFGWNEVNKADITGSLAFGSSPVANSAPWEITYTVPLMSGNVNVDVTLKDRADRSVLVTIQFRADNQKPFSEGLEIGDNASDYVYYDNWTNVLYYSAVMGDTDQLIDFTALGVMDALCGMANFTFDAVFNNSLGVVLSAPYTFKYGINGSDVQDNISLMVTLFDRVGNFYELNVTVIRDVYAPTVEEAILGETSKYLHFHEVGEKFYSSDKMAGGVDFHVLFSVPGDNLSGLYGLFSPTEFGAVESFTNTLPFNTSFTITSMSVFTGLFSFEIRDMVNNSYLWEITVVKDTMIPSGNYTIRENSSFIYYDDNGTLYYGDDMTGAEPFELVILSPNDNQSGVGGVLFPSAFQLPATDVRDAPYLLSYNATAVFSTSGYLSIIIYDNTYNQIALTLYVIRDTTAPQGVIGMSDLSSYMFYDSHNHSFYYSNRMPSHEGFYICVSPAEDGESGIYRTEFPAMFGYSPSAVYSEPHESHFYIDEETDQEGWANISVKDRVGNALALPLFITRDTAPPNIASFGVTESSHFLFYDNNLTLYYNNEHLEFDEPVDFSFFFTDVNDPLSGFLEIYYPAMFSTDESFSPLRERSYTLNMSDEYTHESYQFVLFDRVGNMLKIELIVILDTVAPDLPIVSVNEASDYIYFNSIDMRLWYSNNFDSDQEFTLLIGNISDYGSGIYRLITPGIFGELSLEDRVLRSNYNRSYKIPPTSTMSENVAVTIYDNVHNNRTVVFKIKLDIDISVSADLVRITTASEYIHYDHGTRVLYYGSIPTAENFTVEFGVGSINESGVGLGKILVPDAFTKESLTDLSVRYVLGSGETYSGQLEFRIFDRVNNMATFIISVRKDVDQPDLVLTVNGKDSEDFSKTGKLKMSFITEPEDGASGIRSFRISNDGEHWKNIPLSEWTGEMSWRADDSSAGGNRSEGERKLYFEITDNVSNVLEYVVTYRYAAPEEYGFEDWGPFAFGIGALFWPWGLVILVLLLAVLTFITRRRGKKKIVPKKTEGSAPEEATPGGFVEDGTGGSTKGSSGEHEDEPETDMEYPWDAETESDMEYPWDAETEPDMEYPWDAEAEHGEEEFCGTGGDAQVEQDPDSMWEAEGEEEYFEVESPEEDMEPGPRDDSAWTGDEGAITPEVEYIPPGMGDIDNMKRVRGTQNVYHEDSGIIDEPTREISDREAGRAREGSGEWKEAESENGDTEISSESTTWEEAGSEPEDTDISSKSTTWDDDEPETDRTEPDFEMSLEPGDMQAEQAEEEMGIDRTVGDIIGLLGEKGKKGRKTKGVAPSVIRIKRSSLCVGCNRIIKKNLSVMKCPKCSKHMHMECGKNSQECPNCGAVFK